MVVCHVKSNPYLLNFGSCSGGVCQECFRRFYAAQLIGQYFPPYAEFVPVSQTIDEEHLVDEVVIKFTHTQNIEYPMAAVELTWWNVMIAVVVIVGLQDEKVAYEQFIGIKLDCWCNASS